MDKCAGEADKDGEAEESKLRMEGNNNFDLGFIIYNGFHILPCLVLLISKSFIESLPHVRHYNIW